MRSNFPKLNRQFLFRFAVVLFSSMLIRVTNFSFFSMSNFRENRSQRCESARKYAMRNAVYEGRHREPQRALGMALGPTKVRLPAISKLWRWFHRDQKSMDFLFGNCGQPFFFGSNACLRRYWIHCWETIFTVLCGGRIL